MHSTFKLQKVIEIEWTKVGEEEGGGVGVNATNIGSGREIVYKTEKDVNVKITCLHKFCIYLPAQANTYYVTLWKLKIPKKCRLHGSRH